MTRTEKQQSIVHKGIYELNANFYFEGATGFGKSRIGITSVVELMKKVSDIKCNVVVPSIDLVEQWKDNIAKFKLGSHFKVYTIQSYVKGNWKCDYLIVDEAHLIASQSAVVFKTCLERTTPLRFNKLMSCWLSATLSKENKDYLHEQGIQCAGVVTRQEALDNGWCANYSSYVLMLKMNQVDEEEHKKLNTKIRSGFSFFQGKDIFPLILRCVGDKEFRKQIAQSRNIEEGKLFVICKNTLDAIRRRKQILQDCDTKEQIILEILDKFPLKCLIFGQSTDFSDRITNAINRKNGKETCVSIHSKKSKKENKQLLEKLKDNRFKINQASSAKKLETGIDIPDLEMLINVSYTSKELTNTQKWGRALRLDERKEKVLIISLCVKDSQEETWLEKNGTMKESRIVYSVDEIINYENNLNIVELG